MTTASGGGALHSDHVNYLILRYLQEAGHEKAASAFYTDWHRGPEFRDPETYPFAPVVRRGELVHVIQDGLYHDELLARVKKNERKFQFVHANVREAGAPRREREREDVVENGAGGSRPSSSGAKRKGRPPAMRPPDEFPTPAPKRQRRSEGSDGVHLNGDAMDVDAASASGDAEEDGEGVSPAQGSDVEVADVPSTRYDSVAEIDAMVQTDTKTGPKTSTIYWKVDRPGATIFHSMFNPNPSPDTNSTLLTVGDSLCRFYQVPKSDEDAKHIESIDEPTMPPNSVITASAWHPKGHTAVCAVDTVRELPDGRQKAEQQILSHSQHAGKDAGFLLPPLLDPAGIILAMRYSPNGDYLLVVRTNIKRGLVLIYETSPDARRQEPIAWRIFEHPVLDAVWHANVPMSFIVCGENDTRERWCIQPYDVATPDDSLTEETVSTVGLAKVPFSEDIVGQPSQRWDKISHDGYRSCALASVEKRELMMCDGETASSSGWAHGFADLPSQLMSFAYKPLVLEGARSKALLAAAFEDGSCKLFEAAFDSSNKIRSPLTFHLGEGPALALAWSHDGQHLAIGGHDLVQIWAVESLVEWGHDEMKQYGWQARTDSDHEPLVTWRPDAAATKSRNGEHEDDRPLSEPSLSWSADGERLAFTLDRQIAVISFRPPLPRANEAHATENGTADANGHAEAS